MLWTMPRLGTVHTYVSPSSATVTGVVSLTSMIPLEVTVAGLSNVGLLRTCVVVYVLEMYFGMRSPRKHRHSRCALLLRATSFLSNFYDKLPDVGDASAACARKGRAALN